jgi:hypothetical protein
MKLSQMMFLTFSLIVFLSMTGCGEEKKKVTQKELNPICSEEDCSLNSTWKIFMSGKAFPVKTRLDMNGVTVLDECAGKQKYHVTRGPEGEMILLDHFYLDLDQKIGLEIFERGETCDELTSVLSLQDVAHEVKKDQGKNVVHIHL